MPGAIVAGGCWLLTALLAGCARPAESMEQGRALYESNGCASCHGSTGRGDGPLATKLAVAPIDVRDTSSYVQGTTVKAIAKTLAEGVTLVHGNPQLHRNHHETAMPKFDHLSEVERRAIARYVVSLRSSQP